MNDTESGFEGSVQGPVFEISDLTAGYGDLVAVRGVSISLYPGEVVALLGANGTGKTTTLLSSVGVLPRMSGEVRYQGQAAKMSLHKLASAGLSFVPCSPSVISTLNVRDNLRLGAGGVERALLLFPELEPLLNRRAGLLSGGEQQMLSMARALGTSPKVLLVDEVSLGLAPIIVERLLSAIRLAADERGLAALLVEQQARRALAIADRWYLMANGAITNSGSSDDHAALEIAYRSSLGRVDDVTTDSSI